MPYTTKQGIIPGGNGVSNGDKKMETLLTVKIKNPWTREIINKDVTNTTQEDLDDYSVLMDTQVCDDLHKRLSHCTPGEFLAAWVKVVGPIEAGQIIWG